MENIIPNFNISEAANFAYNQTEPLDLVVKKKKIVVTPQQLNNLKIQAEIRMPYTEEQAVNNKRTVLTPQQLNNLKVKAEKKMPSTEELAEATINPFLYGELFEKLKGNMNIYNSWHKVQPLFNMPTLLECQYQQFDAIHEAAAKPLIILNDDEEYITQKQGNNKRSRSSIARPAESKKRIKLEDETVDTQCPLLPDNDGLSEHVVIGSNGTSISRREWNNINWRLSPAAITRKILMAVFDRKILAVHTLSGKPSPAFIDCNKPEKGKLNPEIVQDIITFMTTHFDIKERDVKCAITSKCADEAKSLRRRLSL